MLFGLNWRYGTIADCLMFHINELRHVALYQSNCNYENVFLSLIHILNMLDELSYEKGSFYIMDKGYVDFTRLHKLHTCGAYFVTRAKNNMRSVSYTHLDVYKRQART